MCAFGARERPAAEQSGRDAVADAPAASGAAHAPSVSPAAPTGAVYTRTGGLYHTPDCVLMSSHPTSRVADAPPPRPLKPHMCVGGTSALQEPASATAPVTSAPASGAASAAVAPAPASAPVTPAPASGIAASTAVAPAPASAAVALAPASAAADASVHLPVPAPSTLDALTSPPAPAATLADLQQANAELRRENGELRARVNDLVAQVASASAKFHAMDRLVDDLTRQLEEAKRTGT